MLIFRSKYIVFFSFNENDEIFTLLMIIKVLFSIDFDMDACILPSDTNAGLST